MPDEFVNLYLPPTPSCAKPPDIASQWVVDLVTFEKARKTGHNGGWRPRCTAGLLWCDAGSKFSTQPTGAVE
jgi:hypothetical protein